MAWQRSETAASLEITVTERGTIIVTSACTLVQKLNRTRGSRNSRNETSPSRRISTKLNYPDRTFANRPGNFVPRSFTIRCEHAPFLSLLSLARLLTNSPLFRSFFFPPPFVSFFFSVYRFEAHRSRRIFYESALDSTLLPSLSPSPPAFPYHSHVIDNVFVIRLQRPNGKFDQPEKMTTSEKWRAFAVRAANRVDPIQREDERRD